MLSAGCYYLHPAPVANILLICCAATMVLVIVVVGSLAFVRHRCRPCRYIEHLLLLLHYASVGRPCLVRRRSILSRRGGGLARRLILLLIKTSELRQELGERLLFRSRCGLLLMHLLLRVRSLRMATTCGVAVGHGLMLLVVALWVVVPATTAAAIVRMSAEATLTCHTATATSYLLLMLPAILTATDIGAAIDASSTRCDRIARCCRYVRRLGWLLASILSLHAGVRLAIKLLPVNLSATDVLIVLE